MGTTSKNCFCRLYLTQVICRRAVILHAVTIATTSSARITIQACSHWQSRSLQSLLPQLEPTHMHATGTQKSWPVLSANLKRKMRSWWGAEALVQRRPVEGCRAEKILRSTNKNMEKRKGRKRKKRQKKTWSMVSEWVRRKACCFLLSRHLKQVSYGSFLVWNEKMTTGWSDKQTRRLVSLTENTACQTNTLLKAFHLYRVQVHHHCICCEDGRENAQKDRICQQFFILFLYVYFYCKPEPHCFLNNLLYLRYWEISAFHHE